MEKERFSGMFMDWVMTFLVVAILATVCNIVGYDGGFIESLPGMLIFGLISLAGLTVKHFVPGNLDVYKRQSRHSPDRNHRGYRA